MLTRLKTGIARRISTPLAQNTATLPAMLQL
jgi:hypothetical protein